MLNGNRQSGDGFSSVRPPEPTGVIGSRSSQSAADTWWVGLWRDYLIVFYAILLPGAAACALADARTNVPRLLSNDLPPSLSDARCLVPTPSMIPTD